MLPNDWHFGDSVAQLSRKIQRLYVERESVDLAATENVLRRGTGKELEAALSVVDTGNAHALDTLIEHLSSEFTEHRLVLYELGSGHVARADGNVFSTANGRFQLLHFLDGRCQVRIRE